MNSTKTSAFLLSAVILLAACARIPSTNPPKDAVTISPTTEPTNSPPPTETITLEPKSDFITQNCVDVLSAMPVNFKVTGIIPLGDYQTGGTIFLDLETGDTAKIPALQDLMLNYAISPDGKKLAYKTHITSSSYSLILTDALNHFDQVIFTRQADFAIYYWLNNEELLLGKNSQWVVYNPYARDEKGYSISDFPDYDTFNPYNIWVGFDPQAVLAIYKNSNGNTSLFDIENKQTVAEVVDSVQRPPVAEWTLDGNQAVVVGATQVGQYRSDAGDNIFSVTRNGQVTQLTYLTEYFGVGLNIHSLSWSPNSHYIAFWMRIPGASAWRLVVLDTMTKKVTDYCILTDPYAHGGHILFEVLAPIWSPDSHQIIIEHRIGNSGYVVLLDINQNVAVQIAQNSVPLGWMSPDK
jgi:hypothetical protein